MELRTPKGTRDLLPPATKVWAEVESIAREVFELYGYREIRTPIIEDAALFERGVGEGTDLVGKEMFSFPDKAGRRLTLRPESTASVCRAYVQHQLHLKPHPLKFYYMGPQFRYERPQKGRYRQFHQIGVELFGGAGGASYYHADVEVISLLVRFLQKFGLTGLEVKLNSVGDRESREGYRAALVDYFQKWQGTLSDDSKRRVLQNPLRILDSKHPDDAPAISGAPEITDYLNSLSRSHFDAVLNLLTDLGIPFRVEPRLVRGLDYYTHTVFEVVSHGLGSQDAICGGGAYANLIKQLGGPSVYGVGFAIGEDRLVELFSEESKRRLEGIGPLIVAPQAQNSKYGSAYEMDDAIALCEKIRAMGVPADWTMGRPEKVFKFAEYLNSRFVIFVSPDWGRTQVVSVRDMESKSLTTTPISHAIELWRSLHLIKREGRDD